MRVTERLIGVVPVGEVTGIAPEVIGAYILGNLNFHADILPPLEHPTYAYDEGRLQYNAGTIIKTFESMPFHGYEKVIAVLEVDLFVPIFAHVFGEARQGGRYALVSLFRLRKNSDGTTPAVSLIYERAAKVALHELGHLYNLRHCMDRRCLMHFSGRLNDLDETPPYLCQYCNIYLRDTRYQ